VTDGAQQFGLAFNLANYAFEVKSVSDKADFKLQNVQFHGKLSQNLVTSKEFGFYEKMGRSKNFARDLANGRADVTTPLFFLEIAKQLKKDNPKIELKYFVGNELLTEGMALHHAVGKASANEPVFINLSWMNDPSSKSVHGLVGKGLTFDCGGLHVKTYGFMEDMYMDKSGASAVLATFKNLVESGAKVNITCSLALAENAIGPNAYRPSDIIKSHNVRSEHNS
jgi:leucyl aminopeptidase